MKVVALTLSAALAVGAAAGCRGERPCNDGTVLLTVTLAGGARQADALEVRPSVEGQTLASGQVVRRAGDVRGTIEVALGDRYRAGAAVTLVVIARADGSALAEGRVEGRLAAGCTTLSVTLGDGATDALPADANEPNTEPQDGGPAGDGPASDGGGQDARSDGAPDGPEAPSDGPAPTDAPVDRAPDTLLGPCPGVCLPGTTRPCADCPGVMQLCSDRCSYDPCACPPVSKRIFVTRARYAGNLGGLAGAHALCTGLASAAGLTGSYEAWLSTAASGPAGFMTHNPGPYVLPTGEMVATSWADLVDGTLLRPIDRDQNGEAAQRAPLCEGGEVWTNTNAAGNPASARDCAGWTSDVLDAALASSGGNIRYTDARWTDSGCVAIGCNFTLPLYCVEQ